MARLYISQRRVDTWTTEKRIAVDGETMTLLELNRLFVIRPAVRFLKVVGDDSDPHDLLGKVLEEAALTEMGADHLATSVIYRETAYEVENGFMGTPLPKGAAAPA
jgi:hypothetical protein